jgi:hypothetical protein
VLIAQPDRHSDFDPCRPVGGRLEAYQGQEGLYDFDTAISGGYGTIEQYLGILPKVPMILLTKEFAG